MYAEAPELSLPVSNAHAKAAPALFHGDLPA